VNRIIGASIGVVCVCNLIYRGFGVISVWG